MCTFGVIPVGRLVLNCWGRGQEQCVPTLRSPSAPPSVLVIGTLFPYKSVVHWAAREFPQCANCGPVLWMCVRLSSHQSRDA